MENNAMHGLKSDGHDHGHVCCHDEHYHAHHCHTEFPVEGADVHTTTLGGAAVCSYQFSVTGEEQTIRTQISCFLTTLGTKLRAQGSYVGHIKASVRMNGAGYRYSLTGDVPDEAALPADGARVEGVAIVMRISENALEQLVCTEIANLKS